MRIYHRQDDLVLTRLVMRVIPIKPTSQLSIFNFPEKTSVKVGP
jgi:hypothetical protein